MRVGIDIVHIPRVEKLLQDWTATGKIFSQEELTNDVQTMAGRFAAKEAYFKALGEKRDWRSVMVLKREDGSPYLECPEQVKVSISHDGEYAVAVVLIE